MKCTIKDIARLSGVSASTVSRVISGNARISEETRAIVRKVMAEQHYQPNLLARSLVNQQASALGVLTKANPEESMKQSFFSEALRGMAVASAEAHRQLLISAQIGSENETENVRKVISSGMVDGVVLLSVHQKDDAVKLLRELQFPFVVLGSPDDASPLHFVDNDNVAAGREAAQYLIERGHRRIAIMGTDERYTVNVHREQGCMDAIRAAGLSAEETCKVADPLHHPEEVYALMHGDHPPDALIALDDPVALYLLGALGEQGYRVPEDVSLITFNNNPVAPYLTPPLTSIEVYPYELGREAVRMLLKVLTENPPEMLHAYVPVTLLERGSVRSILH